MKIGILTQPLHNNYGGLLQNYALQQVLKGMGHDVETIDHSYEEVSYIRRILSNIKTVLKCFFFPSHYKNARYSPNSKEIAIIRRNTDYFINKHISHTKVLYTSKEFDDIAKSNKYDAYVVGSDQCWRPRYNGSFLSEMFLRFAENQSVKKRIAYAASFGTDEWEFTLERTIQCAALIKKFDLITVREASGIDLCKKHLGVDATHVLDPTMLLNKEDYIKLVENENEPQSLGNLFYYILDPSNEKTALIDEVAEKNGLTPFTAMPKYQAESRTKEDVKKRIEDCIFPSVTSWLRAFMDAEMVIVDSFHGAVFAIIFNKPFWVIANAERGNARFESLLGMFKLEDRMIISKDDVDYNSKIDWAKVNEIREREKDKSLKCLEVLSK